MSRPLILAAMLLLGAAPQARAQRLADLPNGTLLRVRTEGTRGWHDGTLVAVTPDSLALAGSNEIFVVPRGQIRALERRERNAPRAPRVLVGGALGAVAGVVSVAISVNRCQNGPPPHDMCGLGAVFVLPAAMVGFSVGAIAGALLPTERWHAVELP